jgi:hypothetical protein
MPVLQLPCKDLVTAMCVDSYPQRKTLPLQITVTVTVVVAMVLPPTPVTVTE